MRINFFMLLIALLLCGLIFFGFYQWTGGNMLYTCVSSAVSLFFLVPPLALRSEDSARGNAMANVFSSTIFVLMLIANVLFARYEASTTLFVLVNGVLFCIWAAVYYGITKAKQ